MNLNAYETIAAIRLHLQFSVINLKCFRFVDQLTFGDVVQPACWLEVNVIPTCEYEFVINYVLLIF